MFGKVAREIVREKVEEKLDIGVASGSIGQLVTLPRTSPLQQTAEAAKRGTRFQRLVGKTDFYVHGAATLTHVVPGLNLAVDLYTVGYGALKLGAGIALEKMRGKSATSDMLRRSGVESALAGGVAFGASLCSMVPLIGWMASPVGVLAHGFMTYSSFSDNGLTVRGVGRELALGVAATGVFYGGLAAVGVATGGQAIPVLASAGLPATVEQAASALAGGGVMALAGGTAAFLLRKRKPKKQLSAPSLRLPS